MTESLVTPALDTYTVLAVAELLREEAVSWGPADGDAVEWIGYSANFVDRLLAEVRKVCPRCEVDHLKTDFQPSGFCGWCSEDFNPNKGSTSE
jgi:hypothetical protein